MTTTIDKILQKAIELETKAAALRLAATLLNGDAHAAKKATAGQVVRSAIALRQAQRPSEPLTKPKPKKPRGFHKGRIREQRGRTHKYLTQFSLTEARKPRGKFQGLGSLVRRGYIVQKGEGYLRTAKAYVVAPTAARPR